MKNEITGSTEKVYVSNDPFLFSPAETLQQYFAFYILYQMYPLAPVHTISNTSTQVMILSHFCKKKVYFALCSLVRGLMPRLSRMYSMLHFIMWRNYKPHAMTKVLDNAAMNMHRDVRTSADICSILKT